jgi:hypothetical protein
MISEAWDATVLTLCFSFRRQYFHRSTCSQDEFDGWRTPALHRGLTWTLFA